jgi:hypothetical protein
MIDVDVTGDDGSELMQKLAFIGFHSGGFVGDEDGVRPRADGGLLFLPRPSSTNQYSQRSMSVLQTKRHPPQTPLFPVVWRVIGHGERESFTVIIVAFPP